MLIYHPAYDIYHTSYRILTILENDKSLCMEMDRVRIYDFLLLFPHDLHNVTLPVGTGNIKRNYRETPYNKLPSRKKVFNQIKNYFDLSAQCLISYGALDLESYKDGVLCKGAKFETIVDQLSLKNKKFDSELLDYFVNVFGKITIEQLKHRFHY